MTTKNRGDVRPHEALAFYRALFQIERQIKDLSDEERLQQRQQNTVPLLAQFKAWLDQAVHTMPPKDTFGIAVNYALKHWDALTHRIVDLTRWLGRIATSPRDLH